MQCTARMPAATHARCSLTTSGVSCAGTQRRVQGWSRRLHRAAGGASPATGGAPETRGHGTGGALVQRWRLPCIPTDGVGGEWQVIAVLGETAGLAKAMGDAEGERHLCKTMVIADNHSPSCSPCPVIHEGQRGPDDNTFY